MSNAVALSKSATQEWLNKGSLALFSTEERTSYYLSVCERVGVDPVTRPFMFLQTKDNRLILYATRECTEQLRKKHNISLVLHAPTTVGDTYTVKCTARMSDGRTDEASGSVSIKGISGNDLANKLMTAETKAKRRVTLSICGLGMLDETEIEGVGTKIEAEDVFKTLGSIPRSPNEKISEEYIKSVQASCKEKEIDTSSIDWSTINGEDLKTLEKRAKITKKKTKGSK